MRQRKKDPKAAKKKALLADIGGLIDMVNLNTRTSWITEHLPLMLNAVATAEDEETSGLPFKHVNRGERAELNRWRKLAHSKHMKVRASAKHGWLAFVTHTPKSFLCEESTDAHTFARTPTNSAWPGRLSWTRR